MYTTHLTLNIQHKYTKVKVLPTQGKNQELSSFAQLYGYPVKSLADANLLEYICWHTLTTDWLPAPLRPLHTKRQGQLMAMFPTILGVMQHQCWVCKNPLLLPMDDIGDSTLGLCNGNATPTLTRGVNGPLRTRQEAQCLYSLQNGNRDFGVRPFQTQWPSRSAQVQVLV